MIEQTRDLERVAVGWVVRILKCIDYYAACDQFALIKKAAKQCLIRILNMVYIIWICVYPVRKTVKK